MLCLFAHGFEGRPDGCKPRYLSETLGHEVIAPAMNRLGFALDDEVRVLLGSDSDHVVMRPDRMVLEGEAGK